MQLASSAKRLRPWAYLLPVLIGLVVFTTGPILASFLLSFSRWDITSAPIFIGLANYTELFSSQLFRQVIGNTAWYVALYVPLNIAVSLGFAMLLTKKLRGLAIFRTMFFLPVVTSMVAAAMIFRWLYNADTGLLNYLLSLVGITGPRWLDDPHWTMPALVIVSVWKNAGYNMMIFLAGLANVPTELHEAARLDGAGSVRRFFRITLPVISPVLFFVLVVTTISAFQVFEQTYVLTGNGPGNSTLTLSYDIWETAFQFFNMGSASAMAYIMFASLAILTFLQFRIRTRWVFQE